MTEQSSSVRFRVLPHRGGVQRAPPACALTRRAHPEGSPGLAPGIVRFSVSLAAPSADTPARTAIATVPPSAGGAVTCAALRAAAAAALGLRDLAGFALTNGSVADIITDGDAAALRPGDTLHLVPRGAAGELQPLFERISFPPHPKVLTDNGDCA